MDIDWFDSFLYVLHLISIVCRQLETGVQAIFGPSDPLLGGHIQSICEALDVPHVETRIDLDRAVKEFSINLYPSQEQMNVAYRDLMAYLNWTKVAIIYEEDYGLFKQQELMRITGTSRAEMYIRQATPETYRQVLKEIRQKEIYKVIVDTNPTNINAFFRGVSLTSKDAWQKQLKKINIKSLEFWNRFFSYR